MTEGRQRHDWQLASAHMALLANINRGKSGKRFKPADFDPFSGPAKPIKLSPEQSLEALAKALGV